MLKKIVADYRFIGVSQLDLALATIARNVFVRRQFNNYLIFDGAFWHTLKQLPLYVAYPEEYSDTNHYGSFFNLIITPFAILPKWVGYSFWIMANAVFLYWATRRLSLPKSVIARVLLIVVRGMCTAAAMQQFDINIIVPLVGVSVFIQRGKSH